MAAAEPSGSTTPPEPGAAGVNQGATGSRPVGESPAASVSGESDAYDERPEAFVGAAFVGGFALAWILKRVAR